MEKFRYYPREIVAEAAASLFEIDFSPEVLEQLRRYLTEGHPLIIVGNHQSHADVLPLGKIVDTVHKNIPEAPQKFYLAAAVSIQGGQGKTIELGYKTIGPWLKGKGIEIKFVTRERDLEVYEVLDDSSTTGSTKELLTVLDNDIGLIDLISGTVAEGRYISDKDRRRQGMKKIFKKNLFTRVVTAQLRGNHDPVILPIGFYNSFLVLNPEGLKPSFTAVKAFAHNLFSPSNPPVRIAAAKVGTPFLINEILSRAKPQERLPENIHGTINNGVLEIIASLVLPEQRGEFR